VITRFAPSPTGFLHLGHAYAALFAAELAHLNRGRFLLRLEDIDTGRVRPEYEMAIYEDLRWLGLAWPEPVVRQSTRREAYQEALEDLAALGVLYPCFCTRKDLSELNAPHGPDGIIYPGTCRDLSATQRNDWLAAGKPLALRLDVQKALQQTGPLIWEDAVRGRIQADPQQLGDVVLSRKDVGTSYHLAVTVDDAAQGVTVVTRGEDLFHATHVHRLLQSLLGLPVPKWHHHRLILNATGNRLAKRDQAQTLRSLREAGRSTEDIRQEIGL
jgi:glutamyl-Q tRNA(Asp) synthetase